MSEVDVTLTDYAIFIECLAFGLLLARRLPYSAVRNTWLALFLITGTAALTGGTVHGYFPGAPPGPGLLLWVLTLWLIGAAAVASLLLAAQLCLGPTGVRLVAVFGALEWLLYAIYVAMLDRSFLVAVVQYLPAALLLLAALLVRFRRGRESPWLYGSAGLLLMLVAGALQQAHFTPLPTLLTHNAFYHVLQMLALLGLFITAYRTSK